MNCLGDRQERYLTINEVSQYLNVKACTVYSWVKRGEIPHYRLGKLLRFKRGDVDNWMESQREGVNVVEKKARVILKAMNRPGVDINHLVKKTIAQVKGNGYTVRHRETRPIRDLRKEVSDGAL
jgi:excisionase family DNA binding protein